MLGRLLCFLRLHQYRETGRYVVREGQPLRSGLACARPHCPATRVEPKDWAHWDRYRLGRKR